MIFVDHPGWVWIDTEWVSDDAFARRPQMESPNIARLFLDRREGLLGNTRVTTTPILIRPERVESSIQSIYDPCREVPIAVFTEAFADDHAQLQARVLRASRSLAGVCRSGSCQQRVNPSSMSE